MIRMINRTSARVAGAILFLAFAFHTGLSQESNFSPSGKPKAPAGAAAEGGSGTSAAPTFAELQKQLEDLHEQFAELHKQAAQAKDKAAAMKELLQKYHAESMKAAVAAANYDSEKVQMLQKENASLKDELDKLKISNESLGKTNLKYQAEIAVLEDKVKKLQEGVVSPRPAPPKIGPTNPPDDTASPVSTRPSAVTLPFSQPAVMPDKPIRAQVEAVERDIAVIDAGVSAGVKEKVRLYIIRNGKVIATVKIMNVVGEMSSGIVEDKKQEVQKGDMAVSEVPAQ